MERRKYLGRVNPQYIKAFSSQIVRVDEHDLKGYAALVQIKEVFHPFFVGETCLYDAGYSEINFLPDGAFWQLSAIYNHKSEIVEWYFDITRKNAVDEDGKPYCDDLYLDAALLPDGQILVLDEDELIEALDSGNITRCEYDMAHATLQQLMADETISVPVMETLCTRLMVLFA